MSRNLCKRYCDRCGCEEIGFEEEPRELRREEARVYYDEYKHQRFANACCALCGARYLAWFGDWQGRDLGRFTDLSYRSTFNDEPGRADLPPFDPDREARDPTTSPERLMHLVQWAADDVVLLVARNPNLPLDQLAELLTSRDAVALEAWHNPAVPLLLLEWPSDEHEEAAGQLLWRQTRQLVPSVADGLFLTVGPTLEELTGMLGRLAADHPELWSEHLEAVPQLLELARHLAGLFGLPWPPEP